MDFKKVFWLGGSYFLGFIGLLLMLDGMFILDKVHTRYGVTNIGLEYSAILFMSALIFYNVYERELLEKRINDLEVKHGQG